ncbi:hypothetical protein PVAP13_3NG211401 [Panicum virgatum]|uniref:Uncharacterized protein n=1 Tax=Panicum virgatum TaxID=38727 RepID=A0A8T0UF50_PANVG|nr:hypothetical protein PVAP13_3NG211401 [Panicum virgatum]
MPSSNPRRDLEIAGGCVMRKRNPREKICLSRTAAIRLYVSSVRAVVRKQRDPPVGGPPPLSPSPVCRERSASIRSTGSSIQRLFATLANSQSSRNAAALAIPNHPTAPSHCAAAVAPPQYSAPSSRPRPITPPSHRPAAARFPICLRKGSRRILNGDWRQRRARGRAHLQPKEGAPAAV